MRQFLIFICLISAFLSSAQAEREEKKERRNAPAMNNQVSEPLEESQSTTKLKSELVKTQQRQKIQALSTNIAVTLNQASRMSTRKSFTAEQLKELNKNVEYLKNIDETSFEYHLYNYLKTPYNFKEISSLEKAESQNAYNFLVLESFSAYHFIQGNKTELKSYLMKLHKGNYFNNNLMMYAELTLKSLPKDAVIITHGTNDTYPLLISQKIKNIRSDVEIISLDHLLSEDYRSKMENKGYNLPNRSIVDTKYLASFIEKNESKRLVCANSLPAPYLKGIKKDLEVVGFGFSTVDSKISNTTFYEKELSNKLPDLITKGNKTVLSNCLPLLFDVRNRYIDDGQVQKRVVLEEWIRRVGESIGKAEQINSLLK